MLLAEQWIPDLSTIFTHFAAEAVLCLAIPGVILVDLFAGRGEGKSGEKAAGTAGLIALAAALLLAIVQPSAPDATLTTLLRADGLAQAFRIIALATGFIAALAALRGDVKRAHTEFFVCLLGAVVGACLTAAANDLAMLYLSVETLSIAGYLLAGFRKEDPKGSEAAMKYVIFGAISSGIMLYGMTLVYGFAGTATIATPEGMEYASIAREAAAASSSPAFLIAIVLVFAGLAYKVAAAPFQFWCPDVYEGAPTSVAAFLAVASKGAGFAVILRLFAAVTPPDVSMTATLQAVLLIVALITMTIGNVAALRQNNAKRLLAYSAIAHAGYLLLGVAVTTATGASAVVFYMMVYLFMTLGAFYMVGVVERQTGRVDLDAFTGLGFKAPWFGICLGVCLISLTGLPPTAGFPGKFFLFQEVFSYAGAHDSSLFFWGGVIGLLNGVISLGYYAKFLKVMYLCDTERIPEGRFAFAGMDRGLVLVLTVPVLVLGVAFEAVRELADSLAKGIF
ncbi:MAG: NADH-quinone oxidoreductase subunit N [Planctomycetota bacterium]|nr:NADH-quinone oxidoreductase subunit N [Planctomycetota bacterium]